MILVIYSLLITSCYAGYFNGTLKVDDDTSVIVPVSHVDCNETTESTPFSLSITLLTSGSMSLYLYPGYYLGNRCNILWVYYPILGSPEIPVDNSTEISFTGYLQPGRICFGLQNNDDVDVHVTCTYSMECNLPEDYGDEALGWVVGTRQIDPNAGSDPLKPTPLTPDTGHQSEATAEKIGALVILSLIILPLMGCLI